MSHPAALAAWDLAPARVTPVHGGLINPTWRLDGPDGPLGVLQQLNTAIFRPGIHHNIEAVTAHLDAKGLSTPRLVRTRAGELWHTDPQGGAWRVLTWVGERTLHGVEHPAQAEAAGLLVGRFHGAVADLDWTFVDPRPGPHDTVRHARLLREALEAHPTHRLRDDVAPLAEALLAAWDALRPTLPALPTRIVHGDLKISNLRFTGDEAVALIDLDTLAHDTLGAELGDAMRSWCGTAGEDSAEATFDLDVLEAAMRGYAGAAGAWGPTEAEWSAVVPSAQRITTELAMRFAADALHESYFGWDAERFATSGDHNLLRARGQAALAEQIATHRAEAERRVARARGVSP